MKSKRITIIFLVLLCCSLVLTGCKDTNNENATENATAENVEQQVWTCSMHPEIQLPKPGVCPKCNMKLIPKILQSSS